MIIAFGNRLFSESLILALMLATFTSLAGRLTGWSSAGLAAGAGFAGTGGLINRASVGSQPRFLADFSISPARVS